MKILALDDSRDMLDLMKLIFGLQGWVVVTAENITQAMGCISQPTPPDIILVDHNLGEATGPEFIRRIAEIRPDVIRKVPIVMITGKDKHEVDQTHVREVLTKPVPLSELVETVRKHTVGA